MRLLYAGDSGISVSNDLQGNSVIPMANSLVDVGLPLQTAFEANGAQVERLLSPSIPGSFPETADELKRFDAIVISDVSYDSLMLYTPERRRNVPMGPNRLKELRSYIEKGGRLIYCGGYLTFQGYHGLGKWYESPLSPALPVEILPLPDDRVETPEGATPRILVQTHATVRGIPWDRGPVFLGYNKTKARPGATVIAEIGDAQDPFLVSWDYGKGRVFVITTDPVPHWGIGFMNWRYYQVFWGQVLTWLMER